MEEDIIEALNEWPVTNSIYDQTSPLDKIDNPHSVSAFFLRNVGKTSKTGVKSTEVEEGSARGEEEYKPEVLAHVALSKWWRSEASADIRESVDLPDSNSPHTKISFIARCVPGLEFIQSETRRLRDKISSGSNKDDVFSALSSYYELVGNLNLAILHLETAIDKSPQDKEYKWRMMRLKKRHLVRSTQEEVLKKINFSSSTVEKTMPVPKQIRRISGEHLSFEEFFYNYALTNTPVVITGVVDKMMTTPWTMQHIKEKAGRQTVKLKRHVKESVQWARLEDVGDRNMGDFIDSLQDKTVTPDPLYLFDWNLPFYCPDLVQELIIPKYFAGRQTVKLKRHVKESVQWARLEDVGDRNMGDFIDSLQDKTVTPDPLYLFDWNLPFYCPDLVQELIIPKYFAGRQTVKLKRHVKESVQWARLEDVGDRNMGDFIDSLQDKTVTPDPLYLFDWNLPFYCPDLVQELIIPKYFADCTDPTEILFSKLRSAGLNYHLPKCDFLQRTSPKSYYRDSWPSLFIAPAGLTSELHVDSFGSNFWMALLEGKKRWLLFSPKDVPLLYPSYAHPWTSDPVFEVDLANPDFHNYPLLSKTQPVECILEAGELLFVPAGCPHRVDNLDTSLAISGNFVDLSNFDLVKNELYMTGLLHERSAKLHEQLCSKDFKTHIKSLAEDLPWEKFKSWPPEDYDQYDITQESVELRRASKADIL